MKIKFRKWNQSSRVVRNVLILGLHANCIFSGGGRLRGAPVLAFGGDPVFSRSEVFPLQHVCSYLHDELSQTTPSLQVSFSSYFPRFPLISSFFFLLVPGVFVFFLLFCSHLRVFPHIIWPYSSLYTRLSISAYRVLFLSVSLSASLCLVI